MTLSIRHDHEQDTLHLEVDQELSGDTEELLRHLAETRDAIAHLKGHEAELVERLADRMRVGETLWVDDRLFRAKRGKGKVTWDVDGIRSEVLRFSRDTERRVVVPTTGEIEAPEEAALRILCEVAGISYFRVGDLARHGLTADDWRATDPGPIQITEEGP